MAKYNVVSLHEFTGQGAENVSVLPSLPAYNAEKVSNEYFISYFNALMTQGNIHESEKELFDKVAKNRIVPGQAFNTSDYDRKYY